MTNRRTLRALSAGALALSLTLAGCGGSSRSAQAPGAPGTMQPEPVVSVVSLGGLTDGYNPPAAGMFVISAGASEDKGDVTFICAEGGEDCTATVTEDGDATSTGGMVTASNSEAFTMRLAAMRKAITAAALTKEEAIADGAGGSAGYTINIERSRDGAMVAVMVAGAGNNAKFEKAMDLGEDGSMRVLTMDASKDGNVVKEIVVVYSDIDAPTATPFAMVTGQTLNTNDDGEGNPQSLIVDSSNLEMVNGASEFPSAVLQKDVPFDQDAEFMGMFNGAPGTYTCTSTDCTLSTDASGALIGIAGTWHFTPDEGATSDVPDAEYLHYGFWLKKTTDKDGAVTCDEVETFASSSVTESGDHTSVEGTAIYEGGAAGVYVMRNGYDPDTGKIVDATSGDFTADANLTASFGGDDVAANDHYKLTGIIDKFMLSGGKENEWSVALVDGEITSADGTAAGTTAGDKEVDQGIFNATFHGDVTDTTPHTVAGEFNASFTNGSVAGGFGARKQQPQ